MIAEEEPLDHISDALPETMAGLLQCAIDDARKLDRADYYPNYNQWHESLPILGIPLCQVCLAGSVIAGTLRIPYSDSCTPASFDSQTNNLLHAINDMRSSCWEYAFIRIYERSPSYSLKAKMKRIPSVTHADFSGWPQFESHLDSLQKIVPRLREIDRLAAAF